MNNHIDYGVARFVALKTGKNYYEIVANAKRRMEEENKKRKNDIQVDMNKQEIYDEWKIVWDSFHNDIKLYKDWLNCMKGFFGKDFPMIQKFESMVDRFKHNGELHMKHIASLYNRISNENN